MQRPNTTLDFNESYALYGRTQLKLPDFYDSDPLLWFKVVEASFSCHDITESKERYGLVLHALKVKQLQQIEDVLSCSLEQSDDPYNRLKNALISKNTMSEEEKLETLLHGVELGSSRPTEMLRKLKGVMTNEADLVLLKKLFFDKLPTDIRRLLAATEETDVYVLAKRADAIVESTSSSSRLRKRDGNSTSTPRNNSGSVCFYHDKYGKNAVKCVPPCSWVNCDTGDKAPLRSKNVDRRNAGGHVGTINSGTHNEIDGLMKIFDPLAKIEFLIDTGSTISLLPRQSTTPATPDGCLKAINNTPVPTYGKQELEISLNLHTNLKWNFTIAEVPIAVIGIDFLSHHKLLIDMANRKLIHSSELGEKKPDDVVCGIERPAILEKNFAWIETAYPDVFDTNSYTEPVKHNTRHFIPTYGPPVCGRVRRLSPEKTECLRQELQHLLDLDIIAPANSPYGSPVHMVPKGNGRFRITGDYRMLNQQTQKDTYRIPFLHDFVDRLSGSTVFSKLDMYKSYHQIPVDENDIHKTAILTPLGTYVFKRLAMGLSGAAQTFQRFMDEIFRDLSFVFVYIDDILVFSKRLSEHHEHLTAVFDRLSYYGLIVNRAKCVFGVKNVQFLGHEVSEEGIHPLEEKVRAIKDFPKPTTEKKLRQFLGLYNFYRKFVPNCSSVLQPLNDLLGKRKLNWTDNAHHAFVTAKEAIFQQALLAFLKHGAPITLVVDVSEKGAGGALQQVVNGVPQPLMFFSQSFNAAQKRYSTFDRELLAMYMAVRYFGWFLESRDFRILTDHKPLAAAFKSPMPNATSRQSRQMSAIAEYTTDIEYIKGSENVVADCLSRVEVNALFDFETAQNIDYVKLALEQKEDDSLQLNSKSLKLVEKTLPDSNVSLLGDMSTGRFRVLVPPSFQRLVYEKLHNLSHGGTRATRRLISERFVWPKMNTDMNNWCRTCLPCQQTKIQRHIVPPLQHFPKPDGRFSCVCVDIVGPLEECNGYSYILTAVDRFTRWPEAIPLTDITAKSCANAFLLHWVARYGCPAEIVTDRGRQFASLLWSEFCRFLGCKHSTTTAYHPAGNGLVERFNKSLKVALRTQDHPADWYTNLGLVMLGLRSAYKEDLSCFAVELTLGTTVRLPGE